MIKKIIPIALTTLLSYACSDAEYKRGVVAKEHLPFEEVTTKSLLPPSSQKKVVDSYVIEAQVGDDTYFIDVMKNGYFSSVAGLQSQLQEGDSIQFLYKDEDHSIPNFSPSGLGKLNSDQVQLISNDYK